MKYFNWAFLILNIILISRISYLKSELDYNGSLGCKNQAEEIRACYVSASYARQIEGELHARIEKLENGRKK